MNNIERKPRYAMRKLSIGLVSCMLGFTLMAIPSQSFAAEGVEDESTQVEETHELEPQKGLELSEAANIENDSIDDNNELEVGDELLKENVKEASGEAQPQEEKIAKINFSWKYDGTDPKSFYDPDLDGQTFKTPLYITYVDEDGNDVDYNYYYTNDLEIKFGEEKTVEVDLNKIEKATGKKIKDINAVYLLTNKYTKNYKFGASTGISPGTRDHKVVLTQNMDTSVKETVKPESLILQKDKGKIDVNYKIVEHKNTGEKDGNNRWIFEEKGVQKTTNRGENLEYKRTFEENSNIILSRLSEEIDSAVYQNSLEIFNSHQGKNKKFSVVAEFAGDNAENHSKYYNLTVEGNDINGWTVTLGSNLKQEKIKEKKISEFEKVYIDDDTLDEGTEEVKTKGVNGVDEETYNIIYLIGEDGEKQTVEKNFVNSKKITKLVNEIIRRGTRKKSNPSGPIITPGGDATPTDPQIDVPSDEDDEEYRKLIQDLIDEINKETEKQNQVETPTDVEKPVLEKEDKKESENENKAETTNPKKDAKKDEATPTKKKHSDQKGKKANPKTGVTGSAAFAALGLSSLFASLGLRKKND